MKNKETQQQRVIKKLLRDGYITRNECLRNFISRLGAIICDLQQKGWEFDAKYLENKDYIYKVTSCPLKKIVYTLPNGETIENYVPNSKV